MYDHKMSGWLKFLFLHVSKFDFVHDFWNGHDGVPGAGGNDPPVGGAW
ncbi:hypothetical protein [Streptomyces sp. NPDC056844]